MGLPVRQSPLSDRPSAEAPNTLRQNLSSGVLEIWNGAAWATYSTGGGGLTSGAVTSGYIGNAAVVGGSIASGAIDWSKLAANAVIPVGLSSYAVTSGKVASGAITAVNVASGQVFGYHLASGVLPTTGTSFPSATSIQTGAFSVSSPADNGKLFVVDPAGAVNVSLPSAPADAFMVGFYRKGSAFTVQLLRGGSDTIVGSVLVSASIFYDMGNEETVWLTYDATGVRWVLQVASPRAAVAGGQHGIARLTPAGFSDCALLADDASTTNARTPTAHEASHRSGGTDYLTLDYLYGQIQSGQLGVLSVSTAALAAGAVTNPKLGDGSVSSGKIAAGEVGTPHLAADCVTTAKIASGAITSAELADGSVISGAIGSGQVGAAHLALLSGRSTLVDYAQRTVIYRLASETISGTRAVSATLASGSIRIASTRSGGFPAIGVVTTGVLSGGVAEVIVGGIAVPALSGHVGVSAPSRTLYFNVSGYIGCISGGMLSGGLGPIQIAASGTLNSSGSWYQSLGTALGLNGTFTVNPNPNITSGFAPAGVWNL